MDIVEAIKQAQECYKAPPQHETATCDWIVLPLLHASGYLPREIVPQMKDRGRKLPDYTILPETAMTWYVEAKAWHVALEDNQIIQALNYANHNGRRWVVLTNGKIWRLYDNSIQDIPSEKLAAEISLENTRGMTALLQALNKASLEDGALTSYAADQRAARKRLERRSKVHRALSVQLLDQDSAVVNAVAGALRLELGEEGVLCDDIADFFRSRDQSEEDSPMDAGVQHLHPGFRERIVRSSRELVAKASGLTVDTESSFLTSFVANTWHRLPRVSPGWSKQGYVVLMWIHVMRDRVKLCLEIGPGPQDIRQSIFDFAKTHQPPFNPGSTKLYPQYSRIFRRDIVSQEDYAKGDFSIVENVLRVNWEDFVRSDLPKLEAGILSLFP